jgi:WbqC-like protein family
MKAAIIQSSFIPWKGYFDIIHDADVFVFLEDVQYTRRDWRSRNRIKTPGGVKWLSIPVAGGIGQQLWEARIEGREWAEKHKKTIHHSYASSPYYGSYKDDILGIFEGSFTTISVLNIRAIKILSRLLGIQTKLVDSRTLRVPGRKDDKLIGICQRLGADEYLSGPSAQAYIRPEKFSGTDIRLSYKNYDGYPEYRQLWGGFEHYVSVIDLIFNCGERAPDFIWGWRKALCPVGPSR